MKFYISCILLLSSLYSLSFARPFDWQYNYTGAPFAIFYNPSLIGSNSDYAFGLDARYLNKEDYDGRFALVVPVGNVAEQDDNCNGRNAFSAGGMYASGENYFLTAGFTAVLYRDYMIKGGASAGFAHNHGESPVVSLNAAFSAPVTESDLVSLTIHNFFADAGLSMGAAGLLYSNPDLFSLPYDLLFSFYFDKGKVSRTEGAARLGFDLTPLLTGRGRTGHTLTVWGGYGFVNYAGGERERLIYAALGLVFVNRASSAAVWGGYGRAEGGYGAFTYNSLRENSRGLFAKDNFSAVLQYSETDSGQVLFTLDCRGTNIESWVLSIDGLGDRTVKTFSGGNIIPATILWDRLDSEGSPLKENEPVHARLVVKRRNGAAVESSRESITAR